MRCAVLGDPIEHSLSPVLHRAGYAAVGLDWTYDAVRVASGSLGGFLDGLDSSAGDWRGLSLTMPLKREVLPLAGARTPLVELAGVANTVVLDDGERRLDNTDVPGAVAALAERGVSSVGSAAILGAGATAASVGLALCELGARTIVVHARDAARAAETVSAIARHPASPSVSVRPLAEAPVGDVVVSTIPASAQDDALVARCLEVPVVFEVLYDPWPTPLAASVLAEGADAGRVLVGGLDLLVHQAALQFRAFTGLPAPLAAMRTAGEAALAARTVVPDVSVVGSGVSATETSGTTPAPGEDR